MTSPHLRILLAAASALALTAAASAEEMQRFPATLAGHAVMPALTFVPLPADAPKSFAVSGKFAAADRSRRAEPGTIATTTFTADPKTPRSSGTALPLPGQPAQGMSGIEPIGGGSYLMLSDNGYGNKINSVDVLLMVHRMEPDFASGELRRRDTVFLRDPDRRVPFHIVNENTDARYLTGGDFDPEAIRVVGAEMWIGDEFGPYLIQADMSGRVLGVFETKVGERTFRSPDHFMGGVPAAPGEVSFDLRRSRGFEPLARSPDGRFLYAAFEGPIWDAAAKSFETANGRPATRIMEFSVAEKRYTGRWWPLELSEPGHVVGDMAMVDATSAVLIERDDATEGARSAACAGEPKPDCFNKPAAFKRIVKIVLGEAGQPVRRVGFIDLLDIADPDRKAKLGGRTDGRFEMPHQNPEGLAVVDADHIVVVNDNNLPYSSGRAIGRPDDNELALLRVPELLRAR